MQSQRTLKLNPYKPGEQPNDRPYIKLNANENPYPPPSEVAGAVTSLLAENPSAMALYPDPDSARLCEAIAGLLNATGGVLCRTAVGKDGLCSPAEQDAVPFSVTPDMIFVGNGSDEVLSLVFYAFFDGDRPVIQPEHTYSFYPVYAGYYGIPLEKIPLRRDYSVDSEAMARAASRADSGMVFANPNAPTGTGMSRSEVRRMLENAPKNRVHVVDEAYADFGGESCIPLLAEFPNLVVVRTFSKSLSFAGMRLGYAVAGPELISVLHGVKDSFNHFPVDALAQVAGAAACACPSYYAEKARVVAAGRDDFFAFLSRRGWDVVPSSANFLFAAKDGVSGEAAYRQIKSQGILVRHFPAPGIERFIRISVGTPRQMDALKDVFERSRGLL